MYLCVILCFVILIVRWNELFVLYCIFGEDIVISWLIEVNIPQKTEESCGILVSGKVTQQRKKEKDNLKLCINK